MSNDNLIYLMQFDEWDLNQDERDAIKAIILERDGLKAELADALRRETGAVGSVAEWEREYNDMQKRATTAESAVERLKAENERMRAALEQYAAPGNWDSRGGWMNCFFNIGDEGPDIAREALEPKP